MLQSCCCRPFFSTLELSGSPARLLRQHATHLPASSEGPAYLTRGLYSLRPRPAFVWLAVSPSSLRLAHLWFEPALDPRPSEISIGGPGDFAIISLLPPTLRAPSFSSRVLLLQSALCHRLSGDPQVPAHTQSWNRISNLRISQHQTR